MIESQIKDTLSRFGAAVKTLRHQRGISQEELADRSGLHRTYVTDVERGARNVSLDSMTKLARALNTPLTDLFAKVEAPGGVTNDPPQGAKPVEILLVEDSVKDAQLTLMALEKYRFTNPVLAMRTGEEALDFLFAGGKFAHRASLPLPRMILLDLNLPDIGGLDVLRRIRADDRSKSLSVVVLTASRSDQDYKESMKLGVTAYLNKPVDFIEFSTAMPKIGFRWQLLEQL